MIIFYYTGPREKSRDLTKHFCISVNIWKFVAKLTKPIPTVFLILKIFHWKQLSGYPLRVKYKTDVNSLSYLSQSFLIIQFFPFFFFWFGKSTSFYVIQFHSFSENMIVNPRLCWSIFFSFFLYKQNHELHTKNWLWNVEIGLALKKFSPKCYSVR